MILATFHEPELLILDEPTSGLDPLMQEEAMALIVELRDSGCAVFLSSHELDEVERVCDRVGMVRAGRLIAVERIADLAGRAQRAIRVEFAEPAAMNSFGSCRESATSRSKAGGCPSDSPVRSIHFLKILAGHRVLDLDATKPTLEETFLTYYEKGGEG